MNSKPSASIRAAEAVSHSSRFGVFGVGPHLIGIPVALVKEMFVLPEIRRPPGLPGYQRGLATMRGSALPAIDLRVCLGLESASIELEATLELLREREQDHRDWLTELEASVRENRAFTLATDPRICKFGQWYYSFKAEDAVLRGELAQMERPHAAVHALAGQVEALKTTARKQEALDLLEGARRGVLEELVLLCGRIRQALRDQQREIGVTTVLGERRTVLIVDRAEAVTDLNRIPDADDPLVSGELQADLVHRMARWSGSKAPVLLLDVARIATL